jgi:hypothetical protein
MTPFEIAGVLVACMQTAFTGDAGAPAEICHRPGDQVPLNMGLAQDECCSGLGWVRVQSIDPVIDPAEANNPDYNACDTLRRTLTIELGVARCNPFGTNNAGPACEQWTELAARIDLDATAMRRAVCCAAAELTGDDTTSVYRVLGGSWTPLESSGGCAGGSMTVAVWTDCTDC